MQSTNLTQDFVSITRQNIDFLELYLKCGLSSSDIIEYFFDQILLQADNRESVLHSFDTYYFKVRPKLSC